MNEILGLFVLASPFSFILLIMVISIIVALIFSKNIFGKKRRVIGGIAIVVLTYFGLTGQELIGSKYHEYLCENKMEYKVYEKIKLPDAYWNNDGSLKLEVNNGKVSFEKLKKFYIVESIEEPYIDSIIKIKKIKIIYLDATTKHKIAEELSFSRFYGWMKEFSLSSNVSETCRNVLIRKYGGSVYSSNRNIESMKFMSELFIK